MVSSLNIKRSTSVLTPIMSRETEYSLVIRHAGKGGSGDLPSTDECIRAMMAGLFIRPGVMPFLQYLDCDPRFSVYRRWMRDQCFEQGSLQPNLGVLEHGAYIGTIGRVYREMVNPYFEVANITCTNPFALYRYIRRGEKLAGFLSGSVSRGEHEVLCFNAVSDRKGKDATSCGMHNEYLISRELFQRICPHAPADAPSPPIQVLTSETQTFIGWLVLRYIFTGAGKIGHDLNSSFASYQISERADFVSCGVADRTSEGRPIINTRDESHADDEQNARLHVINGEGNRSPWAFIFEAGLTSLVLMALQDDALHLDWYLAFPTKALHVLSRDLDLNHDIEIVLRTSGLVITKKPLALVEDFFSKLEYYLGHASLPLWCGTVFEKAKEVSAALAAGDPEGIAGRMLDWKIKKHFLENYMREKLRIDSNHPQAWTHPKVRELDLKYHRIDDDAVWRVVSEYCEVIDAEWYESGVGDPAESEFWNDPAPEDTQAYLLWLVVNDEYLRNCVSWLNWGEIGIWDEEAQRETLIYLDSPRNFGKTHLLSLLAGDLDFSTMAKRKRLIQLLFEHNVSTKNRKYPRYI